MLWDGSSHDTRLSNAVKQANLTLRTSARLGHAEGSTGRVISPLAGAMSGRWQSIYRRAINVTMFDIDDLTSFIDVIMFKPPPLQVRWVAFGLVTH